MKKLPILTLLAATIATLVWMMAPIAQGISQATVTETSGPETPASPADARPPKGEPAASEAALGILEAAQTALLDQDKRLSVSAKFEETALIGDQKFRASGTYTAARFPKLRLEYQVRLGKTTGTLLEICDGQLLWSVRTIETEGSEAPDVQVSRTVINYIIEARQKTMDVPETLLIARMGVGGLPSLLSSLQRSMTFDAFKTAEYEGKQFSVIQGRWNEEYLARMGGAEGQPLPEYVPDRVRIYFDKETLFPTRILYLKQMTAESQLKSYRLMLSLDFSDIVLNGPVSEEQFRYVPPVATQVENRTTEFLELINTAKAQAAESNGTP